MISDEKLEAIIETTQKKIKALIRKQKELEGELKVYRKLLGGRGSGDDERPQEKKLGASAAILKYLEQVENATMKEIAEAIDGKFYTANTLNPRTAIYAALAALKANGKIVTVPGDSRSYMKVEEDDLISDVQRAVG